MAPLRPSVFESDGFADYELLDTGEGEKLERFGPVVLRRPDPQALWARSAKLAAWDAADLSFVRESDRGGRWEARDGAHRSARAANAQWDVRIEGGRFVVRPTAFKHVGVFPEQAPNWLHVAGAARTFGVERPRLLNLFAYTGVASVLAVQAGYDVTHVDASKTSIGWTRENAELSGLGDRGLRLVLDDALAFTLREARRETRYHAVLLDPPHYGRGPKGEKWQFEDAIGPLVGALRGVLAERALVILSAYAIGCSPLTLENLLADLGDGELEAGELALTPAHGSRRLPAGFCARWRGSA